MATLLRVVIGSLPSISDKEATSEKLVSHHLVILILFIPGPLSSAVMIAYLDWTDDDTWLVSFLDALASLDFTLVSK